MDNGILLFREFCYFLLIVVDFALSLIYSVFHFAIYTLKVVLQQIVDINMTDKSKNHQRGKPGQHNQTFQKGIIDENWQKLLSSSLMEAKSEKNEINENRYTGIFRRARKEKTAQTTHVRDFKKLEINNTSLNNNTEQQNSDGTVVSNTDPKYPQSGSNAQKNDGNNKLTKFIAMDCEMVGVGYEGRDHMLARVSLVNKFGDCIYDTFVKPRESVVDYRTNISGIRKEDLQKGKEFSIVQKEVSEILQGRILVGHSLKNDLGVLYLSHPKKCIRDTSRYKPFRSITKGGTPSLKLLAKEILGIDIQDGEHSSVEDSKAVMQLYCTVAKEWEQGLSGTKAYRKKFVQT